MLLAISVNAIILACDSYRGPKGLKDTIKTVNYTCTIIFCVEFVFKLIGLGLREYFREVPNWLDFLLVSC